MKDSTLLELAAKWERDFQDKGLAEDGSPEAKLGNALAKGVRIGMQDSARQLRELVKLLGGEA